MKASRYSGVMVSIAMALLLSGCGRDAEPEAKPSPAALKGMPLGKTTGDNRLARRLAVQGTWTETSRPITPGRRIVIEIAGTSEYTIDLRGHEGGTEAVFASGRGRLEWSADDLLHGKGEADGQLAAYRNWTAGFPRKDRMVVRVGDRDVEMTRLAG